MLLVRACKNPTINWAPVLLFFLKEVVGPSYSEASIVEKAPLPRFRSMLEKRPEELF